MQRTYRVVDDTFVIPMYVAVPGGRQILVEDPSGNLVELFEPAPNSQ